MALQDVQNVTLSNNVMVGVGTRRSRSARTPPARWSGATRSASGYEREVGFDDDLARDGYQGPPAD